MASEDESIGKMEDNGHRLRRQQRPDRGDSCVVKQPEEDAIYDELERGSSKDYHKTSKKSSASKEPELHPHTWASSEAVRGLTRRTIRKRCVSVPLADDLITYYNPAYFIRAEETVTRRTVGLDCADGDRSTTDSGKESERLKPVPTPTGQLIDLDCVTHPTNEEVKSNADTTLDWNNEVPLKPTPMSGHVKSTSSTVFGWNDEEPLPPTPMRGHVRYIPSDNTSTSATHVRSMDISTSGTVFGWNDEEPLQPTPMRGHVRYIPSDDTSTSATHVGWKDQSTSGAVFGCSDKEPLQPTPMTGSVRNEQPSSTEGLLDDERQERFVVEPISIPHPWFEDQIIYDASYGSILDGNLDEPSYFKVKDFQTVPSGGIPGYTSSINPPAKCEVMRCIPIKPKNPVYFEKMKVGKPPLNDSNIESLDWGGRRTRSTEYYYLSDSSLDKDNSSADEAKAVHKDKRWFTDLINPSLDAELSDPEIVDKSNSLDSDETNDMSCNASFSLEHDPEKDKLLESFSRVDNNVGSLDVTKSIDVTIGDSPTCMFVEEQSPKEVDDDDKSNGSDIVAVVERKSESLDKDKGDQMDAPNDEVPQATNENSPESKEYSDFVGNESVCSLTQDLESLSTNDYPKTLTSSSQNEDEPSKVEAGSVFAWIQSSFISGVLTYSDFRQMLLHFKQFLIQHERLVDTSTALELPEGPGTALAGFDMCELMTYNYVQFMEFFQSYQEVMFPNEKKEVPKKYVYNKTYAEWYSEKVKRIARQKAAEKARKEEEERKRLAKQKFDKENTTRSFNAWKRKKYIARMERCRIEKEKVSAEQANKIAAKELKAKVADAWWKAKNLEVLEMRRDARLEEEREREKAAKIKEQRVQNQISFNLWKERNKFAAKPPKGEIPTSAKGLSQAKSSLEVKKGPLDTNEGDTDNPKPGPSRYRP